MTSLPGPDPDVDFVTVLGAGMAGAACAVGLRAAGIGVRVLDRGRAVGGRMASPLLHGRRVDLGAGYFTVRDNEFETLVRQWQDAGLAREWTSTFGIVEAGQECRLTSGPMRWSTGTGLRSLIRTMLADIDVQTGSEITALPSGHVVLAMPDPQAARLMQLPDEMRFDPVLTLVAGFESREWPFADAAFVHGHPQLEFVADDGARRGDGAPVLVAHSTADFARRHLAEPEGATAVLVAALKDLLGVPDPQWAQVHRWSFAKPVDAHRSTHALLDIDGRSVGLAGDQWCPQGSPRVESAWRSGTDLARAIAGRSRRRW